MGTPVARQFYRLYPRKTLALVAADGALKPYITDPSAVEKFIAPYRSASYRDVQSRMLGSTFSAATPPDARERISAVMLSTPQGVVVGAMEAMFDPAIWKDDPIGAPLLCILAKNPYWNDEYEAYVRRLAPRLEYRVMEGTGHFLMVDKPAEFNAILSNFLTQNGLLGY